MRKSIIALWKHITLGGWLYMHRAHNFPWIKLLHSRYSPSLQVVRGDKVFWQTQVEPPEVKGRCDWALLTFWLSYLLGFLAMVGWAVEWIKG